MKKSLLLLGLFGLGACQNGTITPTAAALGQEYCSVASATGPLTVALLDTNGVPVTVTNSLSTSP